MTTFVLVHGAWHGGWCWNRVSRSLNATGSNVYTPTLTGLGERAHLASRETDLETHIADVLGVLEMEDLTDIVLVGHSYSGIVATAVADRAAGRIAQLVYLDGVVPHDGQCLFNCVSPQAKAFFEEQAGDSWCIPVAAASVQFLGLKREEDVRWVMPKLKPHPIRTFRDAVRDPSKQRGSSATTSCRRGTTPWLPLRRKLQNSCGMSPMSGANTPNPLPIGFAKCGR
jgi:pimeloyl-ACP methyl ester carboxylesterase